MFSVLRSAVCGGHGILHSIFLTCARLVDGAVNMLFSSEIFYFILFIYLFIYFFEPFQAQFPFHTVSSLLQMCIKFQGIQILHCSPLQN